MQIVRIGLDLAKYVFEIHGVDAHGKTVVRKTLRRHAVSAFFANLPPCLIGMEASNGAHFWAKALSDLGHDVRLISPQFVTPYVKSNKNDRNDAEAICEAVGRPNMSFVPVKSAEQLAVQAVHSIAVDASGLVYVADRSNRRIQVFDGEGAFQRQFTIDAPVPPDAEPAIGNMPGEAEIAAGTFAPGAPWAICLSPPPNQVLYAADGFPGRIYKLTLDGKLLGMLGRSGKRLKQFGWIHEMACPEPNVLFVAELLNWRVQKLLLAG